MIYVSYATSGAYEKVMTMYLHPSLHNFNLKHDIEIVNDLGNWDANTHIKAKFLKQMLIKHKCPIVFIDADGVIMQEPQLFNTLNCDIGLHKLDWYFHWHKQRNNPKREYLSGTLYLNYNDKVLEFLDKWILANNNHPEIIEQSLMQIELDKSGLDVYDLPPAYCAIIGFDGSIPRFYLGGKEPVVLHYQVSRVYKRG